MAPLLTALLVLAAGGLFAVTLVRRLRPLAALRRDERLDRLGERVASLLRFGLGQRRVLDREERLPGLLHAILFAAFLVLAVRSLTLFGMGFSEGFHLPGLAPGSGLGRGYAFVKDVVVLAAIVAAAGFLWRRVVTRPERITRSWEGTLILGFILGLMVTEVVFDGAERDAQYGAMEKYVAERAIWLPISHAKTLAAYRPNVSGFLYHVTGNVFLSKAEKK